jgi:hypothetical protein
MGVKIAAVRERARILRRELTYGIRPCVIVRETERGRQGRRVAR